MRKKNRKPSTSSSQSFLQTPQKMVEKGTDLAQTGNSSSAEDGNPNFSIGEEKVLDGENPDSIGEEQVLENESPKSIEGDGVLGSENQNVSGGLEGFGGGDPELIDEDDEEELMMIEDEKPRRVIENPDQIVENSREDLDGEELKFFDKGGDFEHQEQRINEAEGMSLSPPLMNNAVEIDVNMIDIVHEDPIPATVTTYNVARKNPKRKRPLNEASSAIIPNLIYQFPALTFSFKEVVTKAKPKTTEPNEASSSIIQPDLVQVILDKIKQLEVENQILRQQIQQFASKRSSSTKSVSDDNSGSF